MIPPWAALLAGMVVAAALCFLWVRLRGPGVRRGSAGGVPFKRVLDALDEAVLVVGEDGVVCHVNKAMQRFFPKVKRFVGRDLSVIEADDFFEGVFRRCLAGEVMSPEERRGSKDGEAVWLVDVALMKHEGKKFVRLVIRDESQRAQTEQIRREFVANASHELRTPLAIIQGAVENLLDGAVDDPKFGRRFLKTAHKHTLRLGRLVEDMLSISRLESGDAELLKKKEFSVHKCLRRVVDNLGPLIEQGEARVEIDLDDRTERLVGDRFYWEQIFFNLIENALKNNPQPGLVVRVSGRAVPSGGGEYVVEDDGLGIPREAQPFIFKRFYRVQQEAAPDVRGTGLGLSIVKRAVEAHGGTVGVESEPGVQTAFIIWVPKSVAG